MQGARDVHLAGTEYLVEPSAVGSDHVDVTREWLGLFDGAGTDEIHLWDVSDDAGSTVLEAWLSVSLERGEGFLASGTLAETLTLRTPGADPVLEIAEIESGGLLGWPTYGVWDPDTETPLATWRREVPAVWNWTLRDGATGRDEARVGYEARTTAVKRLLSLGLVEGTSYAITTPLGGQVATLEERSVTVMRGELMREMAISIEGGAIPPEILVAFTVGLLRGETTDAS